jgi:hypothetical protein
MKTLTNLSWFQAKQFKSSGIYSRSPKRLGSILDHMELRAICHIDKVISTGDILDIRKDNAAFDGTEAAQDESNPEIYPHTASSDDMAIYIKQRLKYRRDNWGDIWPFDLQISSRGHCTITFDREHAGAVLYTYFLLTLYAKYMLPNTANRYRNLFEIFCHSLAKNLFPQSSGWTVKQSGVDAQGEDAYEGNKIDKLKAISTDLFLDSRPSNWLSSISGDGGVDLVAFHQLYDKRGCLPVVFMQCACSSDIDELENKIWDACYTRLKSHLNLDVMHECFLFSPYDWCDLIQDRRFVVPNSDAVIFDRYRILKILREFDIDPNTIWCDEIKNQVLEFMYTEETFD